MNKKKLFNNKTCALVLVDRKALGLKNVTIINGILLVDNKDECYFEFDEKEGFPLPSSWSNKIYKTPLEKIDMFKGSSYFISVEKDEAKKLLAVFNIESRWEPWCPVDNEFNKIISQTN